MNIPLVKNSRTKTKRTSLEEICEESSVTIPEKSLFLAIISSLLEIILRFEAHPVYRYSEFIKSIFGHQITALCNRIPEIKPNLEFVANFINIITDRSAYPLSKRKSFLNIYLSEKEDVTETLCFFIKKVLMLSFTDENLINQLESLKISKDVVEVCLDKISEIYHLALVIVYEDGTTRQVMKFKEKCPLAYFFVTNFGEVLEMYTNSMVEIEKEPLMLSFLENKIVRAPEDFYKAGIERWKGEENKSDLESEEKIDVVLQDLKAIVNTNLKNSNAYENKSSEGVKKVEASANNIDKDKIRKKTPPRLLNYNKPQENRITVKVSNEGSNHIKPPVKEEKSPIVNQNIPAEIISYLNYVTQVVSDNKIFDRKLQEMTKSLVKNFPEIGKIPERLICSINENPNPAKPPVHYPSPQINQNPVIVNPSEDASKSTKKICIFDSVAEPLDQFSEINCPVCKNQICNKCRIANLDSCVKCKRNYDEEEKSLLQVISFSLIFVNEDNKIPEVVPNNIVANPVPARKFEAFRKCNKHLELFNEDNFNSEFRCAETCGICNFCRISNPNRCERCNILYNSQEKSIIELIRISMEGN